MRPLVLLLALCTAAPALADPAPEEPIETPILVPSPIPVGFLIAWKPMILSVRVDSGAGSQFGSDTFQPFRALGRYTTTLLNEKLMVRAEIEGGQFQTDTQRQYLGSNGVDLTGRLVIGTATRISPGFTVTGSAGLITRYQWGRAAGGAPRIGILGATSSAEFEYRVAPAVTLSLYFEGGLTPVPYAAQATLGQLADASELRARIQISFDVTPNAAVDVGYDFTRWHASFAQSTIGGNPNPDQAVLIEQREHALTLGLRWKP